MHSPTLIAGDWASHLNSAAAELCAAWDLWVLNSRNQMLLDQQRYNVELNACCPYHVLFIWKNNP